MKIDDGLPVDTLLYDGNTHYTWAETRVANVHLQLALWADAADALNSSTIKKQLNCSIAEKRRRNTPRQLIGVQ